MRPTLSPPEYPRPQNNLHEKLTTEHPAASSKIPNFAVRNNTTHYITHIVT